MGRGAKKAPGSIDGLILEPVDRLLDLVDRLSPPERSSPARKIPATVR
jgi:hypothetical protein